MRISDGHQVGVSRLAATVGVFLTGLVLVVATAMPNPFYFRFGEGGAILLNVRGYPLPWLASIPGCVLHSGLSCSQILHSIDWPLFLADLVFFAVAGCGLVYSYERWGRWVRRRNKDEARAYLALLDRPPPANMIGLLVGGAIFTLATAHLAVPRHPYAEGGGILPTMVHGLPLAWLTAKPNCGFFELEAWCHGFLLLENWTFFFIDTLFYVLLGSVFLQGLTALKNRYPFLAGPPPMTESDIMPARKSTSTPPAPERAESREESKED